LDGNVLRELPGPGALRGESSSDEDSEKLPRDEDSEGMLDLSDYWGATTAQK